MPLLFSVATVVPFPYYREVTEQPNAGNEIQAAEADVWPRHPVTSGTIGCSSSRNTTQKIPKLNKCIYIMICYESNFLIQVVMLLIYWGLVQYTVYPKKYAHGICFAVLCCGYTLTDFPISIRLTSLALWQSNDCPSASKATLMNMDKYFMCIHYERLHNHNKAKHNKTVCIFLGIYCRISVRNTYPFIRTTHKSELIH